MRYVTIDDIRGLKVKDDKIMDTKKYRLDGCCSNNQAEQLTILNTLENIQNMDTNDKTVNI